VHAVLHVGRTVARLAGAIKAFFVAAAMRFTIWNRDSLAPTGEGDRAAISVPTSP